MTQGQPLPIRRFLIEGLVIVISILLAFAVDAAWEERGERAQREALLNALAEDLSAVEAELDRVMETRARGQDAAAVVLSLVQRGEVQEAADSMLARLAFDFTWSTTFDAPIGSVEALLSGGNLDLLDDPELARAITAFPAVVADLDREQTRTALYADRFYERLAERGFLATGLYDPDPLPWESDPNGFGEHLDDPEVVNQVSNLWFSHRETRRELEGVRDVVDSIRIRLGTR